MPTPSFRFRVLLGGIFCLAVVVAPLSVASASRPAVVPSTPAHTELPYLAQTPRTFPPPQVSFTVNTTNDTDASSPSSGNCADSAGQCSIRAALDVANAIDQTVAINIPAGGYTLTLGTLDVTDPAGVEFLGAGSLSTTLVGVGTNDVLDVDTAGSSSLGGFAALTNITLSGGKGVSVNSSNGTLEMDGSGITGASALDGAAVDNDGQFWATNSSFTDNKATDDGGAIYNSLGSMRLSGDTFSGDSAAVAGGAIFILNGPASVDNSTFSKNTASDPGVTRTAAPSPPVTKRS